MNENHEVTEKDRLQVLKSYGVLDTLSEKGYDDITLLASEITGTPISLISLIDDQRQWFKSKVGLEVSETPRDIAFCSHAIMKPEEMLVVQDAHEDERFANNPLVTADPHIRFYAGAPLVTAEGHALGTLCVIDRKPRKLSEGQLRSLMALSRQVMAQLNLRKALADLEKKTSELLSYQRSLETYQRTLEDTNTNLKVESATDVLTGLKNRRVLSARLDDEFQRFKRHGSPLSILLIDVDHFKAINDDFGHDIGDSILRKLATTISDACRNTDIPFRYGGEEFAVLLSETEQDGARIIGERIRQSIAVTEWGERPVTVSVGVSTVDEMTTTGSELISAADKALYRAKELGRNRTIHALDLEPELLPV